MSLRATVELSVLTASTSYSKLATEVSSAYTSATSITMDAESGNRIEGSTFHVTLDQVSIHFNTGAESSVSTGDSSALATGKNRTSLLGLPDQDVKGYETRKYSVQPLSDQTGLSTHRPDSDVYNLSDASTNHFTKNRPDTTSVSDIFSRENRFARILSSTFTLDDWNVVAGEEDVEKNYQGDKSNVFGFADRLSASNQKVLQSTSTVLSSAAIHPTKTESDTATVSDTQSTVWDIDRLPESTLAFDDVLTTQYENEKASSYGVGDIILVDRVMPVDETIGVSDDSSYSIHKDDSENTSVQDTIGLDFVPRTYHEGIGVTDEVLIARGKLFGWYDGIEYSDETIGVSDNSSYSIRKDELEDTSVQDTIGLDFVPQTYHEGIGVGDIILVDRTIPVDETIGISDSFSRLIRKDESENTSVQDSVGLAVSHSNLENVGVGDGHTMSQSLRVPETLTLQEQFILSLIPQPRSAVLGASTVGQFYFNGGL